MIDAFTTDINLKGKFDDGTQKIVVVAKYKSQIIHDGHAEKIDFFQAIKSGVDICCGDKICLFDMRLPDKTIDAVTEYVLENKTSFMAVAARTLEEVGYFDAKFRLSPIMLLHKLGLLANAKIVGGVYLDNDDVDLMVQENATLILTPSFDAGYGNGIPNVVSYLKRNLKISLGTADNVYNKSRGVLFEAEVLSLLANASMSTNNAISKQELEQMIHKINSVSR